MWLKVLIVKFFILVSSFNCQLFNDDFGERKVLQNNFLQPLPTIDSQFPTYRLPNDSIPLKYEITLRTDIHLGRFDFNGNVKIHVKILEPTNEITLHYRQITINRVDFHDSTGLNLFLNLSFQTVASREFLIISIPQILPIDGEFIVEIQYQGEIRDGGLGIFRGNYIDDDGNVHWYATTQFEADEARHAMPCYDEPAIRAPMQLTLIHGPSYHAVSNTKVLETGSFIPGYNRTIFEPTPFVQTYLLAFLVSDFKYATYNGTRVKQKVYAKPSSIDNGEGDFALTVIGPILDKHEENLGVLYPLDKMDHVAIREFILGGKFASY